MRRDKIGVLIADDNREFCDVLEKCFNSSVDFEVLGKAHDGLECLEKIEKLKPEVLILDIIMPRLDGLGVLESLGARGGLEKMLVVVVSAIGQDRIISKVMDLGADYFILKPIEFGELRKRVAQLYADKLKLEESAVFPEQGDVKNGKLRELIERNVSDTLIRIGIPANVKGYAYIKAAVLMVQQNPRLLESVNRMLYPKVAESLETTPSRVERAIRHSIEVAWNKNADEIINKMFGGSVSFRKGRPTNSELIAVLADKLKKI